MNVKAALDIASTLLTAAISIVKILSDNKKNDNDDK